MKPLLTLAGLMAAGFAAQAQTPITITPAQYPATATTVENYQGTLAVTVPAPSTGANQTWDYHTLLPFGLPTSVSYAPITGTSPFTGAVSTKPFTTTLGAFTIMAVGYYGFNADGFGQLGSTIPAQSFPLTTITGGANDALAVPAQTVNVNTLVVPLPLTSTTLLARTHRVLNNSRLTIQALGLNAIPFQYVQRITTIDSVAGWGTVRVPTLNGATLGSSAAIPALLVRRRTIEVDSFYLAGAPAPGALLGALGQQQGGTSYGYSLMFFRQNSAQPLMSFIYPNNAYVSAQNVSYSAERNLLATQPAREVAQNGLEAWPNPVAVGQALTLSLATLPVGQTLHLSLRDALGRIAATLESRNGLPATLPSLPAGLYLVEAEAANGLRASRRVVVE